MRKINHAAICHETYRPAKSLPPLHSITPTFAPVLVMEIPSPFEREKLRIHAQIWFSRGQIIRCKVEQGDSVSADRDSRNHELSQFLQN